MKRKRRTPGYTRSKEKNRADRAFVRLGGRKVFLGRYGSPESREKYHRTVAEWLAGGGEPLVDNRELTVVELILRYWKHAERRYRHPDGTPTGTLENHRIALRPVRELYGSLPVSEFGPRALKAVRQSFIERGVSRGYSNACTSRIKRLFKWGVAEELVPATVYERLRAVEGLRAGETTARETEPVRPVPDAHVEAVRPHVSRQIWAMIQLQSLSGARSSEVCAMRPAEIELSGKVWEYRPTSHKTSHRGHERVIYLGPKAQKVLLPFLMRPEHSYLFSPREAEKERLRARHAARKTPLSYGNRPGKWSTTRKRALREHYDKNSYQYAIRRACKKAGVPHWHAHQLRHNAATYLRKEFGIETAKAVLGHRVLTVTQIYAEQDREKAIQAIEQVG